MIYTPADYSDVIAKVRDWYGISSEQAWETINQYNLTPEQYYEILPKEYMGQGADGLYHMYFNNGASAGVYQQASIPMTSGNVAESVIDSNLQAGTASVTEKVRFPGNSVIDEHGNIQTSSGVTKYEGGTASGKMLGVAGNVVSGLAAAATCISLGKKFDYKLYNANPAFWDSIGASTLNPETWNSITADLGDTGLEGAAKTAINFILGLKDDGSTQAYMPADAYNYMAYVLAKNGMFDETKTTASSDDATIPHYASIAHSYDIKSIGQRITFRTYYNNSVWDDLVTRNASAPVYLTVFKESSSATSWWWILSSTASFQCNTVQCTPSNPTPTPVFNTAGSYTVLNQTFYMSVINMSMSSKYVNNSGIEPVVSANYASSIAYIVLYGTHTSTSSIDGVENQSNATTPVGINSNSTPQQVADAITQQYPNLYNDRIEQTVVNEDGTTKTIVYYPVPLPNTARNTTVQNPTTITPDTPVTLVLPEGQTLTLPDGTTITGDGKTPHTIPGGTYVLPSNTVITNNYYVTEDKPDGGTQVDPTATSDSTNTLLQTIINILTNPKPQNTTDVSTSDPTSTPNPPDTGGGSTPSVIVPVGSASALWSVYNPTLAELNSLGAWLWSNNFVDQLLKMFNDPMQAIIGLHKTFIPPVTGSSQNIRVGYLDSGVSSLTVPTQYSTIDCGTVDCSEYFGNVFDYSPYTRVYIYLPFIGFKELDVAQVMRSRINVKYHGDAFTGACLAEVHVTRDMGAGGVLYSYSGDCAARYPLSHGSYMGIASALAGIGIGIGTALAGAPAIGIAGAFGMASHARASVEHSGSFSGNSGAMGIKKPYLVIMRPQTAMASNYEHFTGQPSNANVVLGSASGYVRVKECHVEDIATATDAEKQLIESALKTGVII